LHFPAGKKEAQNSVDAKKLKNLLHTNSIFRWLRFVEQKSRELFEQKNTIPKGLNSYNFEKRA
jgi:hypothetical protein